MAFDFEGTVLATTVGQFARPIVVFPVASQPGEPPYNARGVFSSKPVDVMTEGGAVYSDQVSTLGIRYSEFLFRPLARDWVTIPANGTYPALGDYEIQDVDDDGEGHAKLTLKKREPQDSSP